MKSFSGFGPVERLLGSDLLLRLALKSVWNGGVRPPGEAASHCGAQLVERDLDHALRRTEKGRLIPAE